MIKINKKIFLIAILLFIVPAVCSLRTLQFQDADKLSCTEDGVAKFDFFYYEGEGEIDMDSATVLADGIEVEGKWVDRDERSLDKLRKGKRAYFISDVTQFMEDRLYDMQVEYPDDDGSMAVHDFQISCPGFVFACPIFAMNIERCYSKNGVAYLEVSGSGFGQHNYEDLITQFTYLLKGSRKRHEGSLEDTNAEITEKDGLFTIKVPLGYSINWAYIRGKPYGCDITIDDYDTITYKQCTTITDSESAPVQADEKEDTEKDIEEDVTADDAKEDEEEISFFGKIWRAIVSIFK